MGASNLSGRGSAESRTREGNARAMRDARLEGLLATSWALGVASR
jgi:hypothetical protein